MDWGTIKLINHCIIYFGNELKKNIRKSKFFQTILVSRLFRMCIIPEMLVPFCNLLLTYPFAVKWYHDNPDFWLDTKRDQRIGRTWPDVVRPAAWLAGRYCSLSMRSVARLWLIYSAQEKFYVDHVWSIGPSGLAVPGRAFFWLPVNQCFYFYYKMIFAQVMSSICLTSCSF